LQLREAANDEERAMVRTRCDLAIEEADELSKKWISLQIARQYISLMYWTDAEEYASRVPSETYE
jgi:hypothetical protein